MKPKFFRVAKKASLRSSSKFRIGAVTVSGSSILSIGHNNMTKSHPMMEEPVVRLHAEVAALRGVRYRKDLDLDLYVYRVKKDGSQGLARPCSQCIEIMKKTAIKHIFFSLDSVGYGDLSLKNEKI